MNKWEVPVQRWYNVLVLMVTVMILFTVPLHPSVIRKNVKRISISFDDLRISLHQPTEPFIPKHFGETDFYKPANIPQGFLIEEEDFCRNRPDMEYLVYVQSAISDVEARNNTRLTWANPALAEKLGVKMGVLYVFGKPKDEEEERIVKYESDTYHDIIQGDFVDTFRLLAFKGLATLNWITRHCSNVPWTLHIDDDTIVDIMLMDKALKERGESSDDAFLCEVGNPVVQRTGKWSVDIRDMPDKYYPSFCNGGFWALQTRNVQRLLKASQNVNYFWVDDVYVTGYLPMGAGGIKHTFFENYDYHYQPVEEKHLGKTVFWFNHDHVNPGKNWAKIVKYYQQELNITN